MTTAAPSEGFLHIVVGYDLEVDWRFDRLQGIISDELVAVAAAGARPTPGQTVVIVTGSSSHAGHRLVGSVPVSLARHSPVPSSSCPRQRLERVP